MTRYIKYTLTIASFFYASSMLLAQDKKITLKQLPTKARQFLETYYEKVDVKSIKEDVESWFENKEYKVKLQDGKEIEFDHEGNWKEIDSKRTAVPLSLIPENILAYVKRSFPKTEIIKLQKTAKKYVVSISNGLELEFNKKGKFIKIED